MKTAWDGVVVGGGAGGLSAALVLGSRQRTLLIDAGAQSNLAADGIGGLLGQDGRSPAAFYKAGREELARYPSVQLLDGHVLRGERGGDGFILELADGSRATAPRVVLATGMEYRYQALPGIAERWGRSVFHCPYCHGWEVRGRGWACCTGEPLACIARCSCAPGASMSPCSPMVQASSIQRRHSDFTPPGSRSTNVRWWDCAA